MSQTGTSYKILEFDTERELDAVDITSRVDRIVEQSGIAHGIVNVFVPGSTGAVISIEAEDGLIVDLRTTLERWIPRHATYRHQEKWRDDNAHSHLRATVLGASFSAPVRDARLVLGNWQQILFIECDIRPRKRRVLVTVTGSG